MNRTMLTRAAGIVAFLTVVSRIFGFVREASLAAVFGATDATDAYLMAQIAPLLFLEVIVYALTTTFIPVYSQVRAEKGKEQAFRLGRTVIRLVFFVGIFLVGLGEMLTVPLVQFIAPGFDWHATQLTVYLSRIIFPMVVFRLVSGVITGMLQAEGRFGVAEAAGLVQNAVVIGATLVLGHRYGVSSVAVGLLVGSFGSLAVKVPALASIGFRWGRVIDWQDPGLRSMLALILPAIIGAGANQINVLIDRILASGLPEGRVSALNYAVRLNALAPAILGNSIITVMYPTLAKMAVKQNWQKVANDLVRSLGVVHFLLAPIAIGAIILREPLVRIAFERGAFDASATSETAWAFLFLAVGMVFTTMRQMVGRAFFALQNTTTPMLIGLAIVGVNIGFNLLLVGPLEQGGLALGTSLASLFGLILSVVVIDRKLPGGLPLYRLLNSVVRTLIATGLMAGAVSFGYGYAESIIPGTSLLLESARVAALVGLGAISYAIASWALGVPELKLGTRLLRGAVENFGENTSRNSPNS